MRPSQQKNRMRGRGRKQPNPLSRNFESNGPEVKIRGNASHIAEKYATLARDAGGAGDRVMAENYLQHAEHYNRIVAAAAANASRNSDDQAGSGRGPQPDIHTGLNGGERGDSYSDDEDSRPDGDQDSVPDGEQPRDTGPAASEGDEQAERPRRPKRRPRKQDQEGTPGGNGADARSQESRRDEGDGRRISSDAAKLPGNLLGTGGDGDSIPTGASNDD
jgi:hypothetical protein